MSLCACTPGTALAVRRMIRSASPPGRSAAAEYSRSSVRPILFTLLPALRVTSFTPGNS